MNKNIRARPAKRAQQRFINPPKKYKQFNHKTAIERGLTRMTTGLTQIDQTDKARD